MGADNTVDISPITADLIRQRTEQLRPHIAHTPSIPLSSHLIRQVMGGGHVALKLECFQHTGTFKARGALSNAMSIPEADKKAGITAASAGNHAIAAAWAARVTGLSAKVVMQDNANPFRIARAEAEGAEVILRAPGAPTFAEAERLSTEEGRTFIHPFEGVNTALGTAGVGYEFISDMPDLDAVVVSVGGGGLISGIAAAVKLHKPGCMVFGVEPTGADSMSRSLAAGQPVTLDKVETIADSLGPPMALPLGHALCAAYVDDMVRVTDDQICAGMVALQQEAKLAVEPAAGAAMAGLLGPLRKSLQGKRVGVVVCGANIDAATYQAQLLRGMDHYGALLKT
ncbi:pyridoxal-phosphate dependent enzyme [Sulfitobacter mediterraneus]|uniref:pyridoxal-phosphate dependent enzyme n=1 Tax=Sulfitobacter mediterraneus TaxID=83219 RepID=UPI0021A486DF|nr:pyridoxal-phosphate dependent enzyme [Sulfitobacter mediterraneus]UWR11343.1 pyridoxal-phosphate dependent enzyme [Sulfitobacter mediterraneus]